MKQIHTLYLLITFFFIVHFPTKGFAGNFFKSEGSLKTQIMILKFSPDTGIIKNKIAAVDTPVLISDKFSFTEGPAVDIKGNIFFTDQPNDKIWKYDTNGKLSLFMNKTGRSNGLYFDKKGNIIACADEQNQLLSISPEKKVTVLIKDFKGQKFNGPNDLWVNPESGGIYFTDPYYPRSYWKKNHTHIKEERVYYLAKNKKNPAVVAADLLKPNGIIGTPDGKFLYIADIGANKTYKYEVNKNGSLTDKQLFVNQGSDGMTIDRNGNIYLTGDGVTVYNTQGQMIQHISIPEDWTGNVCFGGKNKDELFITASKSLYVFKMNVKGVQ